MTEPFDAVDVIRAKRDKEAPIPCRRGSPDDVMHIT